MVYSVRKRWGREGQEAGKKAGVVGKEEREQSCGSPAMLRATAGQDARLIFREHSLTTPRTADFKASVA